MAIKSFTRSTIENNIFYRSMLAGNAFYNPSDEDILAEEVLTGTQASVTFSNLSASYGSTYQHLQVRATLRGDRSPQTADFAKITFNADTTGYARHALYGNGSTVASYGLTDVISTMDFPTAGGSTNQFGAIVMDVLDAFETTKNTTIRLLGGSAGTPNVIMLTSGLWVDTSAVDSIKFESGNGNNFVAGSRFTLIGLK